MQLRDKFGIKYLLRYLVAIDFQLRIYFIFNLIYLLEDRLNSSMEIPTGKYLKRSTDGVDNMRRRYVSVKLLANKQLLVTNNNL